MNNYNMYWCFIFFLILNFYNAQNKRFIYEYKFSPDSLNMSYIKSEYMILNVSDKVSQFYSEPKYKSDSLLYSNSQKGIISMPISKKFFNDRIIKYINSNQITFISFISNACYNVKESLFFKWEILPEYDLIFGYKVQKAITYYHGRKWFAWFCNDIPISDGPYKFNGLPGLILKIFDASESHVFEIKGIENTTSDFNYPELNNYSNKMNIDYKQYKKLYKNYLLNPVSDLIGKIPDYIDSEGNHISGQLKVREIEEFRKDEIKKNNNILEPDLFK